MEHCEVTKMSWWAVCSSWEWLNDTLAFHWPDSDEAKLESLISRHKSSAVVCVYVYVYAQTLMVHNYPPPQKKPQSLNILNWEERCCTAWIKLDDKVNDSFKVPSHCLTGTVLRFSHIKQHSLWGLSIISKTKTHFICQVWSQTKRKDEHNWGDDLRKMLTTNTPHGGHTHINTHTNFHIEEDFEAKNPPSFSYTFRFNSGYTAVTNNALTWMIFLGKGRSSLL